MYLLRKGLVYAIETAMYLDETRDERTKGDLRQVDELQ